MNEFIEEIVLADRENCKDVANKLKHLWIIDILLNTGMDIDDCLPESGEIDDQTIEQKAKLRYKLEENEVLILDNHDDNIKIYIQEMLIAEWQKPSYVLKTDLSQINPKKRIYVEIKLSYWSVFNDESFEVETEE